MKNQKSLSPIVVAALIVGGALLPHAVSGASTAEFSLDLHGDGWHFAIDPVEHGESTGWHAPVEGWDGARPHTRFGWDELEVPHDYLIDPRFEYTGTAWYRHSVNLGADALIRVTGGKSSIYRLHLNPNLNLNLNPHQSQPGVHGVRTPKR